MAFTAAKLSFFGSIETLLVDVQSVTSSELSLKQLAALIEDEFHMERQHMEKKNDSQNYAFGKISISSVKSKALSVSLSAMKWMTGIFFILLLALILAPERTADSLNALPLISRESSAPVRYSLSDIDWYFYAMQLLRRGSTIFKLEKQFPITNQDLDGCILNNPLFVAKKVKCSPCREISGFYILELKGDHSFHQPAVIEGQGQGVRFSLGRLQQVLQKNEIMVNQHTISIITNCDYVNTVEDLKYNHVLEQLEKDNVFHIALTATTYMSSHIWRKEFPIPQDFTSHAAQTFKNYFYIDGKNSPTFQLQSSLWESNFMYIQGSGSRRLVFSPPDHCNDKCKTFSWVMKTGDIVLYNSMWTVHSEPTTSKDKSIAYVDNFEWLE